MEHRHPVNFHDLSVAVVLALVVSLDYQSISEIRLHRSNYSSDFRLLMFAHAGE